MPFRSILIGVILTLLGFISYLASGGESWTALIPAFIGIPMILLGYVAKKESARKHAMHAALGLAMIGFLGSIRGLPGFLRLLSGEEIARPGAAIAQVIMALACIIFVALGVKSFIDARRKQAA
jgi:hypothetical protein